MDSVQRARLSHALAHRGLRGSGRAHLSVRSSLCPSCAGVGSLRPYGFGGESARARRDGDERHALRSAGAAERGYGLYVRRESGSRHGIQCCDGHGEDPIPNLPGGGGQGRRGPSPTGSLLRTLGRRLRRLRLNSRKATLAATEVLDMVAAYDNFEKHPFAEMDYSQDLGEDDAAYATVGWADDCGSIGTLGLTAGDWHRQSAAGAICTRCGAEIWPSAHPPCDCSPCASVKSESSEEPDDEAMTELFGPDYLAEEAAKKALAASDKCAAVGGSDGSHELSNSGARASSPLHPSNDKSSVFSANPNTPGLHCENSSSCTGGRA